MRRSGIIMAAGIVLVLAGCGGGSSGESYDSAQAVAKAVDCGAYKQDDQTTMFAADTGACQYRGHDVSIDWFKDGTSLDNYRKVADSMGGSVMLYGSNWAIACVDSKDDCSAFKEKIGGSLG